MATTDDPPLIFWGRCRSGRRWFWTANEYDGEQIHGWADTPNDASSQANAAALKLAAGRYANIHVLHGTATQQLKKLNVAKRIAKAPKSARTGAVPPPNPVGYLYGIKPGCYALDDITWIPGEVVQFPITKKTAKRIYYQRPRGSFEWESGYVDRQELEAHGSAHVPHWLLLFAEPPEIPKPAPVPGLKELKAAMADAHPDRGGTDEAFIAARDRYLRAKARPTRLKEYV